MKKKILIITQHFPPEKSGNASRIFDISTNLKKSNFIVTIFSPFPTFPHGQFKASFKLHRYNKKNELNHHQIFSWPAVNKDPPTIQRLLYYTIFPIISIISGSILRKTYDVIMTSSPPIFTHIPGLIVKKLNKDKIWICDVRDLWIDASTSLGFLKKDSFFVKLSKKYEKICLKTCDIIITTTEKISNNISNTYNISRNKIQIVPNGVDTTFFKPHDKQKENQIIYAGNIGHAQDLEKVIKAMKNINKSISTRLILVGDGDTKQKLEQFVKKEKMEKIVIFKGIVEREKIPELISASLLGIAPLKDLPTLEYAMPTKVYEYMSCEIPFVATGIGEIEKCAAESGAGIVIKNSVQDLEEKIIKLLKNQKEIDQMGKKGRRYVIKNFDRATITKKLVKIIDDWKIKNESK